MTVVAEGACALRCAASGGRRADLETRGRLIESHIGLAKHLAQRFANRGEPIDDLIQVACLGLVKAAERFDPGREFAFTTYATQTVLGELKRHFRDKCWSVRPSRRMQELHLRLGDALAALTQELGRSPTVPEVAEHLGVVDEDVLDALEAGQAYRTASLDAPGASSGHDHDAETLGERIGSEDEQLGSAEARADVAPLLSTLPRRQQQIVYLRFFEGLTQSEIAARIGVSQMQVSRLLARSLETLRRLVDDR